MNVDFWCTNQSRPDYDFLKYVWWWGFLFSSIVACTVVRAGSILYHGNIVPIVG